MSPAPGTRLGPYAIDSAIGAGGMGEVNKARDTRLDRSVAIEVLPPGFSADPDRRARFEREAKTIAGLNHPHSCTLFDVGEHDGSTFEGTTPASLIGNIMNADPPAVATLQPLKPPGVDRLVKRCLAKDPDARWDTAHDVADELRWIGQIGETAAGQLMTSGRTRYLRWVFASSCLAAGILAGVVTVWLGRGPLAGCVPAIHAPVVRGEVELPPSTPLA